MNMDEAEKIAEDPMSVDGSKRREVFEWLESRSLNTQLSESFRSRAQTARMKIFYQMYYLANGKPYEHPEVKKRKKSK